MPAIQCLAGIQDLAGIQGLAAVFPAGPVAEAFGLLHFAWRFFAL
jgi:hypothetical protein